MKKLGVIMAVCFMGFGLNTLAYCADATLNLDVNSAYVFRGVTFNDGLVLQPSLDVVKGGLDVNIWGNMDIDDYDGAVKSGEFSEVDLAVSYSHTIDKLTLTGGVVQYLFPNGGESTQEVFASGSVALVDGLSVGLAVNYDYDLIKDYYANLSLAYSYAVNKKTGITAGIAAGYAGKDMAPGGKAGFNDYKASLKVTYAVTDMIGVAANINYTDAIDSDVLPVVDVNTFGGVSVNCKF